MQFYAINTAGCLISALFSSQPHLSGMQSQPFGFAVVLLNCWYGCLRRFAIFASPRGEIVHRHHQPSPPPCPPLSFPIDRIDEVAFLASKTFEQVSADCGVRFRSHCYLRWHVAEVPVDFNQEIRPLLSSNCLTCHGPDEDERAADLRFDTQEGSREDLGGYAAIVPGDPDSSRSIVRLTTEDEDLRMPPEGKGRRSLTRKSIWFAAGSSRRQLRQALVL